MIQLEDLRLMAALAKSGSLSAAARSLRVTTPALSVRLKRLESSLGVNLAVRSSHRLGLTAEGENLALEGLELLERLEALPDKLRDEGQALGGRLHVCAPFGFGRRHIAPVLGKFVQDHPQIQLTLDLLETPWPARRDADLVIHIGEVRDSTWVAHPLASNQRWVCASPKYLRTRRFAPRHPRELLGHPCICIRENDEDVSLWHYRKALRSGQAAGSKEALRVVPALTTNDGDVARQWCEQGLGLVLRSEWDSAPAVAQGKLTRLLPEWSFGEAPVLALTPARRGVPARVTALLRFLEGTLKASPAWLAVPGRASLSISEQI